DRGAGDAAGSRESGGGAATPSRPRSPLPIVGQRAGLRALVIARVSARDGVCVGRVLVLVVAQVQDQVGLVVGQVTLLADLPGHPVHAASLAPRVDPS